MIWPITILLVVVILCITNIICKKIEVSSNGYDWLGKRKLDQEVKLARIRAEEDYNGSIPEIVWTCKR